jgi:hypothetical protein
VPEGVLLVGVEIGVVELVNFAVLEEMIVIEEAPVPGMLLVGALK